MKRIILVITIIATFIYCANAQGRRAKWMDNMRQLKMEYVAKELKLTQEQKEKFASIYDAMNKESAKLVRETRALEKSVREKGDNATDLEYEKATDAIFELKGKECDIEKKYRAQLKTVLTKKQLFELKHAEHKFARELMKHHRNKKQKRK